MMRPDVLGRLVDAHAAALVLYARQWCSVPEDVVQEAFVKLVSQRQPPTTPVPWLFRVVRNAALTAGRAERRRRRHETRAAAQTPPWLTAPDGAALDAETVAAALRHLPDEQREVIVAHLWGGLSFEQVAEVAGCSASTAHRWYVAGLSALRERLKVPCPSTPTTPD
jgi:RNA polymerase sigma-70 factor (ECF subfamily)